MQNYLAHIFPLSRKLIKAMEGVCRRFLWSGTPDEGRNSLVVGNVLHLPKSCGGWNLINMQIWSNVAKMKLLWAIEFKRDKLWVKCVHAYYIKRVVVTTVTIKASCS